MKCYKSENLHQLLQDLEKKADKRAPIKQLIDYAKAHTDDILKEAKDESKKKMLQVKNELQ